MNDLVHDGAVDDALTVPLCPVVLLHLHTTVQEKGLRRSCFPHFECFLRHMGAPVCLQSPVCSRLTQLLVLNSFIFESPPPPHKHILLKIMSGTVVVLNPRDDRFHVKKCTLSCRTHYIERGTVRRPFPGPFNTAQPEFFCCKTKLTMLFYIYVFVYTCNVFSCMYI